MFVPHTFAAALTMTILSTICWGSFANTLKLTKSYRFELYYWDYVVGIVVVSLLLAFTMGSAGGGSQSFLANVSLATPSNVFYAVAGGFIFNIANVLLIGGIEMAGLAVAYPIAIGIALVEGVVLSYAIQPKGSPGLLAGGVLLAVLAVLLIGKAYGSLGRADGGTSRKGVVLCVIAGFTMGLFAPLVTRAMTAGVPLTPYSVAVFFTLGTLACCFVFNIYLMKKPLNGAPLRFSDYLGASANYHALGVLGGVVWGVGTVFNFVAASLVGVAISYAIGQASPMIAALWGLLVWREFRGASTRSRWYLAGMFVAYILALLLIASAYRFA